MSGFESGRTATNFSFDVVRFECPHVEVGFVVVGNSGFGTDVGEGQWTMNNE